MSKNRAALYKIKLNKKIVNAELQKCCVVFGKISIICLLILDKNKWVNAILSIGFVTLTIYSNLIGLNPIELRNKN